MRNRKKLILVLAMAGAALSFQPARNPDGARWAQQARNVTIVRDDWGIAHVFGKSDADAVFGAIYAQAEDDFYRVETNYLNSMGRLAETEGEARIYQDLRMKLFIDPESLKKLYGESPAWLRKLMNSWADGLNFYLARHPRVKPRVIQHFEPWMALSFTEGSIGGDIEKIDLTQLQAFYDKPGGTPVAAAGPPRDAWLVEPSGSNGMAIAPSNTRDHHALLLINPHTAFFFRSELEMVSEEGLHAYGAATWGQFFLYQGFNQHTGWMHTSSGVDAVDEYLETVRKKGDGYVYRYGNEERPVTSEEIRVPYRTGRGMAEKRFTVFRTHHGPIVREANGKWVAIRLMQEPVKALSQSYLRTKTKDYKSYLETMELKANTSNNTVFADTAGDIAYFHGNYIPRRDTSFDWTKPVDGSNPATEWKGLLTVEETPHLLNPKSGWLYNSNNWPWSAAGESSPKQQDYPAYVETGGETARGLHAIRVLENKKDFTLDSLMAAAYDTYLTWFEKPIPALIRAWDDMPAGNALKAKTADQIALLRRWDLRWAVDSVPTALAIFWGEEVRRMGRRRRCSGGQSDRRHSAGRDGEGAGGGLRPAARRFRQLEDGVGRDQSLPTAERRHRADLQRRGPEHSGRLPVGHLGIAGFIRGAGVSGHEEVVWRPGKQLRRGGGVWRPGERQGGDCRWRERLARLAALQRPGQAVQHRRTPRSLLL